MKLKAKCGCAADPTAAFTVEKRKATFSVTASEYYCMKKWKDVSEWKYPIYFEVQNGRTLYRYDGVYVEGVKEFIAPGETINYSHSNDFDLNMILTFPPQNTTINPEAIITVEWGGNEASVFAWVFFSIFLGLFVILTFVAIALLVFLIIKTRKDRHQ